MKIYTLKPAKWRYKDAEVIQKLMHYGVQIDSDGIVTEYGIIAIETLEELDNLIYEFDCSVVVSKTCITIYDDYLE